MLNITNLFVSSAFAQDAAPPAPDGTAAMFNYLPFILIFCVFYFLVIRPQQQKLANQEKLIKALQRGDRIVTSGGIHGKITKIEEDDSLLLEIAEGVQIKVDRSNVLSLEAKPQPAAKSVKDSEKRSAS